MNKTQEVNINLLVQILKLTEGTRSELNTNIPAVEVQSYTKKFRKFVASKDVSFNVGHGVIHGFIGPNGSGKTTSIKAMIGAYLPSKGKMLINGYKAGTTKANRLIGYIPERASFPKHLNTIQYLTAMGELSGLKNKEAHKRGEEILKALGLYSHRGRKPISFSSGMQKKILLAQSLLTDPKILILDEPAANLDPTARKELFDQLIWLRNEGKTILISSHILSELERLIDEATFIYYGEVIFSGNIKAFNKDRSDVFIKSTDNPELAKFLKKQGYKVEGDMKTEIQIHQITRKKVEELFKTLPKSKINILSFRSNDLQSVYDKLVEKSEKESRGKQEVDGKKAIAMKTNSTAQMERKNTNKKSK